MSLLIERPRKAANTWTALIDADVLRYRIGFAAQKKDDEGNVIPEPVENALHSCKLQINSILEALDTDNYILYLTGKGNFRFDVAKTYPYKGNRVLPKPYHYDNLTDYLINRWNAQVVDGIEADDALGIKGYEAYKNDCQTVICSIDKDLKMIPGWHYNFVKQELEFVDEWQGIKWFYTQLLTGDATDNIHGIKGIGPKKAAKALEDCETELELYNVCKQMYEDFFGEEADERLIENGRLLWILREEFQTWEPPTEEGVRRGRQVEEEGRPPQGQKEGT